MLFRSRTFCPTDLSIISNGNTVCWMVSAFKASSDMVDILLGGNRNKKNWSCKRKTRRKKKKNRVDYTEKEKLSKGTLPPFLFLTMIWDP